MSHSLPVRHRPRRFSEVTGQESAVDVLSAAAASHPVPQQLLLAGPSGVGKTTLARVFAAALFCTSPVSRPVGAIEGRDACGECASCLSVVGPGGKHPDVIEIDAASYGGVDQIRGLGEQASLAPLQAEKRIYVIDEAHGLTRDGGQAFLKLLEEPPSHTLFILATTDPQKLPVALRGRCVQVFVSAPTTDELTANLHRIARAEGWNLESGVAELVVAATDPDLGVRGTVATLEKLSALAAGGNVTVQTAVAVLGVASPEETGELYGCIRAGDRAGALASLDAIVTRCGSAFVVAQLTRWAHQELSAAVRGGHDETLPLWWVEQMCDPNAWPLAVRVARMCDPAIAGSAGLEALIARAEQAADELTQLTLNGTAPRPHARVSTQPTATTRPPAPTPAPSTPAPVPVTEPVTETVTEPVTEPAPAPAAPAPAAPAPAVPASTSAEAPGVTDSPTQPTKPAPHVPASPSASPAASPAGSVPPQGTDADALLLLNRVGRHGGAAALAVRRGTVIFEHGQFAVTAHDTDGRVAAAVAAAASELGWTVSFTAA